MAFVLVGWVLACSGAGLQARAACPPPVSDCNANGLEDAFDVDCDSSGVPDACEILADCNGNQVADACELPLARSRSEYAGLIECLAGPAGTPPATTSTGCSCTAFFDQDHDGDIDLLDFAAVQRGPAAMPKAWWNPRWPHRLRVAVGAAGYARVDYPAAIAVDFTAQLAAVGAVGAFAPASLRVIEVDAQGTVVDEQVAFQFDPDPDYDASTAARGTLVLQLEGPTAASATRTYDVYFAPVGVSLPSACFEPLVTATDDVPHEGQLSIVVSTAIGTWYYHKPGGGFASLDDVNGQDWIGYHPGGGSAGEYRGIPNGGGFHPGYTLNTSMLESNGPLRARIRSVSTNGLWESTWDIYPRFATMTMRRAGGSYWILYEGTPGGSFEAWRDFVVRSPGVQTSVTVDWIGDLPDPEWVYFGDSWTNRFLYLVHHQDDDASDQFWQMQENMTVFGFGRQYMCCDTYLTAVPNVFTVGLGEAGTIPGATALIDAAWRPLNITVGSPESP